MCGKVNSNKGEEEKAIWEKETLTSCILRRNKRVQSTEQALHVMALLAVRGCCLDSTQLLNNKAIRIVSHSNESKYVVYK